MAYAAWKRNDPTNGRQTQHQSNMLAVAIRPIYLLLAVACIISGQPSFDIIPEQLL